MTEAWMGIDGKLAWKKPEEYEYHICDMQLWFDWFTEKDAWHIDNKEFVAHHDHKFFEDRYLAAEKIHTLKRKLEQSDFITIKYLEGEISTGDWEEAKAQRKAWRDEINRLQSEYGLE